MKLGHRRILLLLLGLLLVVNGIVQAQTAWLHPQFEQQLLSSINQPIRVGLYLREQLNAVVLKAEMSNAGYTAEERARRVIREALALQARTQPAVLNFLNQQKATGIKAYYAVNLILVDASPALIEQLRLRNDIEFIFPDNAYLTAPIEPVSAAVLEGIEVVNGKEPGLIAINAPAMWHLGYTGRGRKGFTVDTGSWTEHPALKRRFLGNYMPLNQAWFSLISETPIDRPSHHGTHVTGTILGLDTATNDTIGVAYNAYFMVSNPLTTNNLTPLSVNLLSFEWALNPDDDTSTVLDIPDVINNSWGQAGAADTTICSSWASQLFNVLEAAGIAITFSAGNEGPNAATVKHPQFINTNDVNIFSVGAVDGNNASLPIASFSSRGPSLCGGSGSLLIKPEVVAPGVNVRSAYGQSGYGLLSGTSMSCPHVSGAILLLKEAFPYLGGDSLLYALYFSASDKGVPGEDNTFGRGMIDVYAAYLYLSQNHSPVPPASAAHDAVLGDLLNAEIDQFYCATAGPLRPMVRWYNKGSQNISQATFEYRLNGGNWISEVWTGNLNANQSTSFAFAQSTAVVAGKNELEVRIQLPTAQTDRDIINNRRSFRFEVQRIDTLVFNGIFSYNLPADTTSIRLGDVFILNPDGAIGWDTATVGGLVRDSKAWAMRMNNYNPDDQIDALFTNNYFGASFLPSAFNSVNFRLAYRNRATAYADSLRITLECNCGTEIYPLYHSGGDSMRTYSANVPFLPEHWRSFSFRLDSVEAKPCFLRFQTTNKFGGNLYLGDLEINANGNLSTLPLAQESTVLVYPNPTDAKLHIQLQNDIIKAIQLYDMQGKLMQKLAFPASDHSEIDLSRLQTGQYILRIEGNQGIHIKRVQKQ